MRIASGRFKGRKLPVARGARPVSSRLKTSLFSVLVRDVPEARVLDLCAGAGGFGLEALSRGAADVTLVDLDRAKVALLNGWIEATGATAQARAVGGSWLRGPLPQGPFDLIFLDPPYVTWSEQAMARGGHEVGFERLRSLLAPDGILVVKLPAKLVFPALPGWHETRRVQTGSSAYVLWSRVAPESVKEPGAAADPEA